MAESETDAIPYLQLDPAIEEAIISDRAANKKNPCAFHDKDVQRRADLPHDRATIARSAFQRDVEKIVNIPAYNRYADKTQVFSLMQNDDICRRGLHVQLVSNVARSIGKLLGLNIELIEAIALGHDLGHTPFGHAGERFLNENYHRHTGRYFNHNVQSVRVLDTLYRRNISLQTLDGVLCHNGEFAQQVLELGETKTFDALDQTVESCTANEANIKTLRPSTLEGCVVRVSDMIAYLGKDRSDALTVDALDSLANFKSSYIGIENAQIINNMTIDIVNNSYGKDRISMGDEAFCDLVLAKRQNYEQIYLKEGMVAEAKNVVGEMFEELYEHLLTDLKAGDESSAIFRHHINKLVERSRTLTRDIYLENDPNQIVVDYIASMTDSYFMALHTHLFPQSTSDGYLKRYCANL